MRRSRSARRFAAGGTLWCWAPGEPQHAQHVAVEFVHPVIIGTRALPAVAVLDDDAIAALRPMAATGDVLLVIADADHRWGPPSAAPRRGVSPRSGRGRASPAGAPPTTCSGSATTPPRRHDGRLVLGYHLLWELTHVCFEHPGLLESRR